VEPVLKPLASSPVKLRLMVSLEEHMGDIPSTTFDEMQKESKILFGRENGYAGMEIGSAFTSELGKKRKRKTPVTATVTPGVRRVNKYFA